MYQTHLPPKNSTTLYSIGKGIIGSQDEEKSRIPLHDWTNGSIIFVPSNGGKAVGWIHTTTTTDDEIEDGTTTTTAETTTQATKNIANIGGAYATICVIKIPLDQLEEEKEEDYGVDRKKNIQMQQQSSSLSSSSSSPPPPNWFHKILEYCRLGLEQIQQQQQQQQQQVITNDGVLQTKTNNNNNNNNNSNDDYVYYKFTDQIASDIRKVLQHQLHNNDGNDDDINKDTTNCYSKGKSNPNIPEPKKLINKNRIT